MTKAERSARMKRMRRIVRKENVFWWVDSFLKAAAKLVDRSSRAVEKRLSRLRRGESGQGSAPFQNASA
jgi:trehalose-6-phosphate synthase